ncbi:MAG TPA: STAS domain-containing protein [Baekduia sp.]|nr:STAS domain-containing protein [Baekduia sp.]
MTDSIVIAPTGELDVAAARDLRPELNEAAGQVDAPVVVDLTGVTFIDSTALGAIVQADGRLRRNGRRLCVVAPPGSAAAVVIELTNLDRHLEIHRSRDAALSAATA